MLRLRLALTGAGLWSLYFFLYGRQFTWWITDIVFVILALLLWLGRTKAQFLLPCLGILWSIACRNTALNIIGMGAALYAAPWVERHLAAAAQPVSKRPVSTGSIAAAGLVFLILAYHCALPTFLMVAPQERRAVLEKLSPSFPVHDPAKLSPLAARLRGHVLALSQDIGERSAYQPLQQEKAKDYVAARLKEAGYAPEVFDYAPNRRDFERKEPYRNVEAVLGGQEGPVWIVGAHYDSAPGTPGADDNASGVAVLLEVARLLKAQPPARGIRFAAFAAEEPPSFGSRDMGSYRYAHELKGRGVKVHGLLNLEMLGYFNAAPKSQLFPPFLHLLYPDRAEFVGLVSNLRSLPLLLSVRRAWKAASPLPTQITVLPATFSTMALSDQLNFWHEGYPAVMVSDTSYFRYPHYHQSGDTAEKLDYEKMALAAEAVAAVLRAPR